MSSLSDSQLAQLDNLIYYISNDPRVSEQLTGNPSVEQIVRVSMDRVDTFGEEVSPDLPAMMSEKEWHTMFDAIAADKTLCSYTIQNYEKFGCECHI